jgi:hypothetical protein
VLLEQRPVAGLFPHQHEQQEQRQQAQENDPKGIVHFHIDRAVGPVPDLAFHIFVWQCASSGQDDLSLPPSSRRSSPRLVLLELLRAAGIYVILLKIFNQLSFYELVLGMAVFTIKECARNLLVSGINEYAQTDPFPGLFR